METLTKSGPKRNRYIVIEGAIGVGKTTLARMLRDYYRTGMQLEVFEENPFLADFYRDRERYAFQTQMFFLLSRYRQQQHVPHLLEQGALISDYMFAKDRLFAELNLAGNEWEIYQQIHAALAEQIPSPDLIVFLRAGTDVLMGRIAQRDRTFERDMDREYIDALCQAYERFFLQPQQIPVLRIDTNNLNYVTEPADFQFVVDRINSALREGSFQQPLPHLATGEEDLLAHGRQLADFQRFHVELDQSKGFKTDLYFNYLCLSEEMGELGSEMAKLWREQDSWVAQGRSATQALSLALSERREEIESELADCMAYLLKISNYAGIDLETAYLCKMKENQGRDWEASRREQDRPE